MESRDERLLDRFMLWIDSVGGYWVCRGDEITIGQPNHPEAADVPILGDIARRHVQLRRDGENILIEALAETLVDGRPVRGCTWLRDGSRIQLGASVCLLFRRPHALSGTVRLEFLSRHRTQPSSDGVLWMADTCILGPRPNSHVVCRNWTREVVLYRDAEHTYCRALGPLEIDGVDRVGHGTLTGHSRVVGDGFSFNLEAITI